MSYYLYLFHPVTGEVLHLDSPHQMKGGTYAVGGTTELSMNVTYNYGIHYDGIGENGLNSIDGLTGAQSLPMLLECASGLGSDTSDDYWKATEGNAKLALLQLAAMAQLRPDGVWRIS